MSGKSVSNKSGAEQNDLVLLGRIGAAHGIRGEVRIQSFTENPLDIVSYGPLISSRPDLTITISKARRAKTVLVASLKGVTDRNEAETLNGVELFVPRDALPEIDEEDDFYYSDLIGLDAQLEDGSSFGQVKNVVNFGAGDILEVTQKNGQIALLPFTKKTVPTVKLSKGYIVLVLPDEIIIEGEEDISGSGEAEQD